MYVFYDVQPEQFYDSGQQCSKCCNWCDSFLFQIHLITGDVTVKEDVERIVSSSVSHFGKLDILVSMQD